MPSAAIVTTTIRVPELLADYAKNAAEHGHEFHCIVAGDRKSAFATAAFCTQIQGCEYLDLDAQEKYLRSLPNGDGLARAIPHNSVSRRNVAILKAYMDGYDKIITIDDDNFLIEGHDFIGEHNVGNVLELDGIDTMDGWFNVCSMLHEVFGQKFYHRGYPMIHRWSGNLPKKARVKARVAVNAGLWLGDPDVNAFARLNCPLTVDGCNATTFALVPGIWSPFNSQNTSLARDVIPAYFLSPYTGRDVSRYDDIWASYVVTRIAEHLGDVIAFGNPLVLQRRNEHDLIRDFENEIIGLRLTDSLCAALRGIRLKGKTYHECFGQIIDDLPVVWMEAARHLWDTEMLRARNLWLDGMRAWHEMFF